MTTTPKRAAAGWRCPHCGKAHPAKVATCPEPANWERLLRDILQVVREEYADG